MGGDEEVVLRNIYSPPLLHIFWTLLTLSERICDHLGAILRSGQSKSNRKSFSLELYSSIVTSTRISSSHLHPPLFLIGDLISHPSLPLPDEIKDVAMVLFQFIIQGSVVNGAEEVWAQHLQEHATPSSTSSTHPSSSSSRSRKSSSSSSTTMTGGGGNGRTGPSLWGWMEPSLSGLDVGEEDELIERLHREIREEELV